MDMNILIDQEHKKNSRISNPIGINASVMAFRNT